MAQLPAHLPAVAKFALTVAVGRAYIIKPILDFVDGMAPRSPVVDAAVAVALVALPATYVLGVILLYVHVTPPAAAPAPAGAVRRAVDLARTLAFALLLALAAFLLLLVFVGSPASCDGLTPT